MGHLPNRERIRRAFASALDLHAEQFRKLAREERRSEGFDPAARIPYIAHLMSVAALVLEHGGTEDEMIAALLHDGPEDQGGEATLAAILEQFGPDVEEVVRACSDTLETPKPRWLPRKQTYLRHLRETDSDSVLLVSLADKVHNLRSIDGDYRRLGTVVWSRFDQGRDGTLWYYGALRMVFRDKATPRCLPLLAEYESLLDRLIEEVVRREKANPADGSGFGDLAP